MKLEKYLKNKGNVAVFYRVWDKLPAENKIHKDIELTRQVQQIANKPKNFFVFSTEMVPYPYGKGVLKFRDIVVISKDKEKGKQVFKHELKKSKKLKKELKKLFQNKLKPFLKILIKREDILACILRGDIISKRRYVTPNSDIDITLITSFPSQDKQAERNLVNFLKKSPLTTYLNYYYFKGNSYHGKDVLIKERGTKAPVSYDVISWPDFLKLHVFFKKYQKKIGKYNVNTYKRAKIIYQKNKIGKKFIREYLSLG